MSVVDAQQFLKSMFTALINEYYSITADVDRYHSASVRPLPNLDLYARSMYMLASNLILRIWYNIRHNSKILISNTDMKSDSNKNLKKNIKTVCD